MIDDILVIDSHNHAHYHGNNLQTTLDNMDRYNIDKAWIMPCEIPLNEWCPDNAHEVTGFTKDAKITFENALYYKEHRPERFILGFCPDPRDPYAIDRLDAAVHTYGIQYCGEWKFRMMFDNWDTIDLYRYCGEHNLPVVLHLEYPLQLKQKYPRPHWWYGGTIESLERALQLCPETTFIGHAPGFWANISGSYDFKTEFYPKGKIAPGGKVPELLRKYPNLYCDISGTSGANAMSRDPEFSVKFIEEFQDKILYGRDLYHHNLQQETLASLNLPKEILRKIYSGNSLKLVTPKD